MRMPSYGRRVKRVADPRGLSKHRGDEFSDDQIARVWPGWRDVDVPVTRVVARPCTDGHRGPYGIVIQPDDGMPDPEEPR